MHKEYNCPWQSASGAQSGTSPSGIEGFRELEGDLSVLLTEKRYADSEAAGAYMAGNAAGKRRIIYTGVGKGFLYSASPVFDFFRGAKGSGSIYLKSVLRNVGKAVFMSTYAKI